MVDFLFCASSSICIRWQWNLSWFQRSMSLIVLRPRCNRRSVVWIWSFKDTPQIHLIIPLSPLTNHWTSSVTTGQVLLPCQSILLTHMLKMFLLSLVQIAWLERIGNNSWNAFHEERMCIETALEQPRHWLIVSPRYLKGNSTWKLSLSMLTSFKDAITAGTISPEHLCH